ncbi:hypothetical protein CERZMDRAFT_106546 [Cercospora zeae-maydis SCOH1-5]|uniref:Uncharacterized protein n=1 Tax=Cercospora zeae-maydis SCOH1-5 TaxID=717836 RepID=A0A6A6FDA9_9PEZI|nr:hypothetical protein CERZMDRAFT_106546 [Cercospora zeae-maydis SCOH1-5]
MSSSLYESLVERDQLLEVDMDDVEILDPRTNEEVAIGTKDLNGCSTIVIVDKGVILAHIAPRGPHAATGMQHFQAKAKQAVDLMRSHPQLFDRSTTTWGIFARLGTDTPLDHYAHWLRQLFSHMHLHTQQAYYDVDPTNTATRRLPTGSVVVLQDGEKRRLYVEDREHTPRPASVVAGLSTPQYAQVAGSVPSSSRATSDISEHPYTQASRASATATADPETRWLYHGGTYARVQGQTVVEQRPMPPKNQAFFHREARLYMMWDGTKKWVYKDGKWATI